MPIEDTLSLLTNTNFAKDVAFVAGGYMGAAVVGNVIERFGPDLPNELYGIGGIAVSTYALSGRSRRYAAAGSGLFTVDALAQRFGVKESVTQFGRA